MVLEFEKIMEQVEDEPGVVYWNKEEVNHAWRISDILQLQTEDLKHFLSREKLYTPHKRVVAVSLDPYIFTEKIKPRAIAFYEQGERYVTEELDKVADILENPEILKVFHQSIQSVSILREHGYPVQNYVDVVLMNQLVRNESASFHNLAGQLYNHLGLLFDEVYRTPICWMGCMTKKKKEYLLVEAEAIYLLYESLMNEIQEKQLEIPYYREKAVLPVLTSLSFDGLMFDAGSWKEKYSVIENELIEIERELRVMMGEEIDLSSSYEVLDILRKKGYMFERFSEEELKKVADTSELIGQLYQYKKKKKFLATYGERFDQYIGEDSRLRGHWQSIGTSTGRMSCSKPNLQGLPKIVKTCVRAKEGHRLVIADYSNIELRILAEISQDQELIDAFRNGEDLHEKTARAIFQKWPTDFVSPEERKVGKIVNFGLVYGMSEYGLQKKIEQETGIPILLSKARDFRETFLSLYFDVQSYQEIILEAEEIRTLGGRRWSTGMTPLPKDSLKRLNYPIQGSCAEGLKIALGYLMQHLPPEWKIVNVVHDEILLEVPEEQCQQAEWILRGCMKKGMEILVKEVPIVIESRIATYWEE